MRTQFSRITALLIAMGSGAGCGGDSGGQEPETSVLTTLEVTPTTASLFTVAPDNSVALSVVGKDQDGVTMSGTPSFTSDNQAVATVTNTGTVSGVTAGTARITASLTVAGVSRTATTTVTVKVAPVVATVTAPALEYTPGEVDVQAGGTVTWSIGAIHHSVTFTTAGSPEDIPELQEASDSRTFTTGGVYGYRCSFHPQMTGAVRVH